MLKSNASAKESATKAAIHPLGSVFAGVSITYIRYLDPWGGGLLGAEGLVAWAFCARSPPGHGRREVRMPWRHPRENLNSLKCDCQQPLIAPKSRIMLDNADESG